jgi:DNA-directed RNA polymerase subunit RPC12/RpoP
MDFVYRCHRCGRLIYRYQIRFGSHRCKYCGSNRIEPVMQDLTKFGKWLLNKWNNYNERKLYKTQSKNNKKETIAF